MGSQAIRARGPHFVALLLSAVLLPAEASAGSPQVGQSDPRVAVAVEALAATEGASRRGPVKQVAAPARPWPYELAAGVLAGALAVPVSAAWAGAVGTASGNLVLAALPAAIVYLALPPLAVSLSAYGIGRRLGEGAACWARAFWWALGVQALGFGLTVLAGATVRRAGDLAIVSAGSALAMGAVVTLTLPDGWWRRLTGGGP